MRKDALKCQIFKTPENYFVISCNSFPSISCSFQQPWGASVTPAVSRRLSTVITARLKASACFYLTGGVLNAVSVAVGSAVSVSSLLDTGSCWLGQTGPCPPLLPLRAWWRERAWQWEKMKQDARSRSADSQQSFSGHTRRNHEGDRSHPSGTVREPDRDQGRDRVTLLWFTASCLSHIFNNAKLYFKHWESASHLQGVI